MVENTFIYYSEDEELAKLAKEEVKCKLIPYSTPKHKIKKGITSIEGTELLIFGNHNLQNLNYVDTHVIAFCVSYVNRRFYEK